MFVYCLYQRGELLNLRTVTDKIIKTSDANSPYKVKTEIIECNRLVHAKCKVVEIKYYWLKGALLVV